MGEAIHEVAVALVTVALVATPYLAYWWSGAADSEALLAASEKTGSVLLTEAIAEPHRVLAQPRR